MEIPPLAATVGMNAQRLRTECEATTDEVARVARSYGLKWTDSRVSAMEKGKVAATVPTLVALALTLGDLTQRPVSLAELVQHDGIVSLNDDLTMRGDHLTEAFRGAGLKLQPSDLTKHELQQRLSKQRDEFPETLREFQMLNYLRNKYGDADPQLIDIAERTAGSAEVRAASDLGVTPAVVAHGSIYLWGRTFSDQRDLIAGKTANAQRRGQATRRLKAEIQSALEGFDDGDD